MPLVVEPTGREIMTMIEGVRQQCWRRRRRRRRRTSRTMAESVEEVWEVDGECNLEGVGGGVVRV
ncbi:unnamed protein product, partial [Musa hybrid cultivar]